MEKRWNERKRIQLSALINSSETLVSARTDNIGMGGMFLKIAPGVNINHKGRISVALSADDQTVTFPAKIVRVEKDGLALKFSNYSPEMLRLLRRLLLDEEDSPQLH